MIGERFKKGIKNKITKVIIIKIERILKFKPKYTFESLVREMLSSDIKKFS